MVKLPEKVHFFSAFLVPFFIHSAVAHVYLKKIIVVIHSLKSVLVIVRQEAD